MSTYPDQDLSPNGAGQVYAPQDMDRGSAAVGAMRAADTGKHGDMNRVGGNTPTATTAVPSLPNFQSQERRSLANQANPELPTTILERKGFGRSDGDWDDTTGR